MKSGSPATSLVEAPTRRHTFKLVPVAASFWLAFAARPKWVRLKCYKPEKDSYLADLSMLTKCLF